ncbi:MAG: peptidylprolyl isomerase [Burkholderiales bacterium]|nr:peptidylprolyl isomerase [Burkholderiales bacterium]
MRIDLLSRLTLSLLVAAAVGVPAVAADKATSSVAATVNGVAIPQADLDFIVKRQVMKGAKDTPEMRTEIRNFLITQQVIADEARKEGLDKSADMAEGIKLSKLDLLRDLLFDNYLKAHPAKGAKPEDKDTAVRKELSGLIDTLKAKAKVADHAGAVAEVNGAVIPQADSDFIVQQQSAAGAKDTPEIRAKIREFLVTQQIIAQEALKQGLDKSADYPIMVRLATNEAVRGALFAHYAKANPITDATLKAEYDRINAKMGDQKEYHARHILVKTEAEAKDVLAALKSGQAFDALAKAKSLDDGSKAGGGDLGWSVPQKFVKEFADALQKLNKGDTTQVPVKTQYGYHIIRVDDVRPITRPTFDQVKGQLQQSMQRQQLEKFVTDLKAKAKVA